MRTSAMQRMRRRAWLAGLAAAVAVCATPVHAQFDTGQVTGFVHDQQGATVPGATVRIVNEHTRIERSYVTDASGYYVAPALAPGLYEIAVELSGFKKSVRTAVRLDAAAKVQVDATLVPGGVEEAITVVAEATPLQSGTGQVSKTIEAKQIQDLMLNGRNPVMLALLKPGVRGMSFSNFQPDSQFAVGLNVNGSRADENVFMVDGVVASRTRSSVAIIGVPNVDTLQEIQILTASYLPEYGRGSGGQIRFVTKGGGRDFHGNLYGFLRDDSLDTNTWDRKASGRPELMEKAAPYAFKQFGYDVGGPLYIPGRFNSGRDKLFFMWAQEWVRFDQDQTSTGTVPTERMRRGDFGELLDPANNFFGKRVDIIDPRTGQPFPGNVIPAELLSPSGLGMLNAYPLPTPGYQVGASNWIGISPNPRRARKDTLRLDWAPNPDNSLTFRGSLFHRKFVGAFQGTFPLVRIDWDSPNQSASLSWRRTFSTNVLNEATVGFARDQVFLGIFQGSDLFQRSKYGIDYPYVFPGKEIEDKIPTISITGLSEIDGSPYPGSSEGPIWTFSDNVTYLRGRHSFKAGVFLEYSGEDDFDQINVVGLPGDTNNQNGRFEFRDTRPGGTGLAMANAAMGLFTNYAEIGKRSFTQWRSLGIDAFLQDSWKAREDLTVEFGTRYVYWPPWTAKLNNIAMFHPAFYDPARAAQIDPRTGAVVGGDRYNGIVLPGNGFPPDAKGVVPAAGDPQFQRLFHGLPEGFSETHSTVFEPRAGIAWQLDPRTVLRLGGGIFHTRVTLNDSTLLGGNPPIQFKVGVANGNADSPAGGARNEFPLVMTLQDPVFKHPTAYNWSLSVQRQLPLDVVADVSYVGRVGTHLQRERNINQLLPGSLQANPGVNPNALRPYKGFATIRLSENAARSVYHGLQTSLERRFHGGFGFGFSYTFSKLIDNGDGKRDTLFNAYDDRGYRGISGNDRTHVINFNYLWELPFWRTQDTLLKKILGGWQVSGVTFFESGGPFWVGTTDDIAGVGDTTRQPWNLVGDPRLPGNQQKFSLGAGKDQNLWINPAAFQRPAPGTFGNGGRNILRQPWTQSWDLALIKNIQVNDRGQRVQLRAEAFNFPNHPNFSTVDNTPTSANFGRVTSKTSNRLVQLGVKFIF